LFSHSLLIIFLRQRRIFQANGARKCRSPGSYSKGGSNDSQWAHKVGYHILFVGQDNESHSLNKRSSFCLSCSFSESPRRRMSTITRPEPLYPHMLQLHSLKTQIPKNQMDPRKTPYILSWNSKTLRVPAKPQLEPQIIVNGFRFCEKCRYLCCANNYDLPSRPRLPQNLL
jgi:hypothetical protein